MSETIFTLELVNEEGEPVNLDGVTCVLKNNGAVIEAIDCEVEGNMISMSDNTPKLKHCTHNECACGDTKINVQGECMGCRFIR